MPGAEPVSYRAWRRPADDLDDDVWNAACGEFDRVRRDLGRQGLLIASWTWFGISLALVLFGVIAETWFLHRLGFGLYALPLAQGLGFWVLWGAIPGAALWGMHQLRVQWALMRLEATGRAVGWSRPELWGSVLGHAPRWATWAGGGRVGPADGHGAPEL